MRMLKMLLVIVTCAIAAVPVMAEPWDEAMAAYERGDYARTLKLMRPLAEQGDGMAQYNLGVMYYKGQGVPQDYAQAVAWYRKAADRGNALAQNYLGLMYYNGEGVPQDYVQAVSWYRKAAEQGHAHAQFFLGGMYSSGQGVPQDYVQAHKWFNLSASRTDSSDKERRDLAVKSRDLIASLMTPPQIAAAQKLAREWKPTQ
jgi:TPR repeat protein